MGKTEKWSAWGVFMVFLLLLMSGCQLNNRPVETIVMTRKDSLCVGLLGRINSDSIKSRIIRLTSFGTRFALAPDRRQVAFAVRDMFKRVGYDNAAVDSFQASVTWNGQDYATWQYNVSAELVGSIHPDSVNIVGAHYDDIVTNADPLILAPGADDNASGVAGMIEVARIMKYINYKPAISIKFVAFGAQEIGLLGSIDYAQKLVESGRPVGIMLNHDMIANVISEDYRFWEVRILFHTNSKPLAEGSANLCLKYIGLYPIGDTVRMKNYDSYSFSAKNIEALTFTSADSDYNYHLTTDVIADSNPTYCSLITGLTVVILVYYD